MGDGRDGGVLAAYDAVLLDLDGTVYHGPRVIPGAVDAIAAAREHGTAIRFVTNNASKTPDDVAGQLVELGVQAARDEVGTSSQAAARLLRDRATGPTVLVVGTDALAAEVEAVGFRVTRTADDDVAAVVQGHSPATAWQDLAEACVAIRGGADWVACNTDTTLPSERGQLPGNGSLVLALRAATGKEPVVAGKPQPPLFRLAADGAAAASPLVVGDRLDTDIAGAVAAGMPSLVVLTGVATPAGLLAATADERPTYLASDLAALTGKVADVEIGPRQGWRVETEGSTLVASGESTDSLDLLRALCAEAWRTGVTDVRAGDERAAACLAELGLG